MSKNKSNVALGALIGIGIGYVAGILSAQQSGKETREDIANFAKKSKKQIEARIDTVHEELVILLKQAETVLKDAKSSTQEGLVKAMEAAKHAKDQTKEVLIAMHRGTADDKDLQNAIDEANKALEHLKDYLNKDNDK